MRNTTRILTPFLLLLPLFVNAQSNPRLSLIDAYRNYFDTLRTETQIWEAGLNFGFLRYDGDIKQNSLIPLDQDHYSIGGFLRLNATNHFALRGNVYIGRFGATDVGDESSRAARGFSFKSSLKEFSGQIEFFPYGQYKKRPLSINGTHVTNYNGNKVSSLEKRRLAPYGFLGMGLSIIVPRTNYNIQAKDGMNPAIPLSLILADANSYRPNVVVVVPIGAGIKWNIGKNTAIGIEGGIRATLTDYLDGVSKSGNPETNDWYFTGSAQISYSFGKPNRKDDDADGVPNAFDKCLTQAGAVANFGCPLAEITTERPIADQEMPEPGVLKQESVVETPVVVEEQKVETTEVAASKTESPSKAEPRIEKPTQPEPMIAAVVPEITSKAILDLSFRPVYFGTNQTQSQEQFFQELDKVAITLLDNPEYNLNISGHSDNVGNAVANQRLSKSRAEYCRAYLIKAGIDPRRLLTEGFGSTRPVVDNITEENRQQNRRVEFMLFQR